MEIARLRVSGVKVHVLSKKTITAGMIGAEISLEFDDPAWDNLQKTVVFNGNTVKDVINPGMVIPVPPEVMSSPARALYVGVFGTNSDKNVAIPTLWANLGEIHTAADPSGDETTNPSIPVYAQLLELKTGPQGPQGNQGIPGKTPVKGVDYFTDDDIAEIVREVRESYSGEVDVKTDETLIMKDGVLSVNTTDLMEKDNTLPITSAGVFATVGNIEALLKTI